MFRRLQLLKKILLEIGFIVEKTKKNTAKGNKQVPKTLLHYYSFVRK